MGILSHANGRTLCVPAHLSRLNGQRRLHRLGKTTEIPELSKTDRASRHRSFSPTLRCNGTPPRTWSEMRIGGGRRVRRPPYHATEYWSPITRMCFAVYLCITSGACPSSHGVRPTLQLKLVSSTIAEPPSHKAKGGYGSGWCDAGWKRISPPAQPVSTPHRDAHFWRMVVSSPAVRWNIQAGPRKPTGVSAHPSSQRHQPARKCRPVLCTCMGRGADR